MTSVAAWGGVDSRKPSSFYFASDSRITSVSTKRVWDRAKKLFASGTSPDILGYCGDVLYPVQLLGVIEALMNRGLLFEPADSAELRHSKIFDLLRQSLDDYPHKRSIDFQVLHATRVGHGQHSLFKLWEMKWALSAASGERRWYEVEIPPRTRSVLTYAIGSGPEIGRWNESWPGTLEGTSRSVFHEFCAEIAGPGDPSSGGAPQLVGLYNQGPARLFGIIHQNQRFVSGVGLPYSAGFESLDWRNELFERCDPTTMRILANAQRQPKTR